MVSSPDLICLLDHVADMKYAGKVQKEDVPEEFHDGLDNLWVLLFKKARGFPRGDDIVGPLMLFILCAHA